MTIIVSQGVSKFRRAGGRRVALAPWEPSALAEVNAEQVAQIATVDHNHCSPATQLRQTAVRLPSLSHYCRSLSNTFSSSTTAV